MYQSLTIVGYLGNKPELRQSPSGKSVTSFNVAVNTKWTDRQGVRQEKVTWYAVSVWDKQAEVCARYLDKGRLVLVEGTPGSTAWIGPDGTPKSKLEVSARIVQFLSTNPEPSPNRYQGPNTQRPAEEYEMPEDDGDIPF